MRRDIGNEVIFAIAAVAVMVFALTFAILLSLTSSDQPTGTPTATVASNVADSTLTPVDSTAVAQEPSATPSDPTATDSEQPTDTPAPSDTATERATATEVESTATPRPSRTAVSQSSSDTPTVARTPVRIITVTHTPTTVPTETKPSATPTRAEPSPTATPTAIDTFSPAPATDILPTLSGTVAAVEPTVASTVVTRGTCALPDGWELYTVMPGNTLFSIARAVGSTVSELSAANCIANPNILVIGDQLFVPSLPSKPVQTGVPSTSSLGSVSGSMSVIGCGDPSAQLVAPRPGEHVKGTFSLQGTATLDNFWYYRIEVRPEGAAIYNFYSRSDQAVVNGQLGTIDTSIFQGGLHWVRISVVDWTGGIPETAVCAIPLVFD